MVDCIVPSSICSCLEPIAQVLEADVMVLSFSVIYNHNNEDLIQAYLTDRRHTLRQNKPNERQRTFAAREGVEVTVFGT